MAGMLKSSEGLLVFHDRVLAPIVDVDDSTKKGKSEHGKVEVCSRVS